MRNVKFRAWDKARKQMNYKVLVGNTDHNDPNYTCNLVYIDSETAAKEEGFSGWLNADEHCINLMQCTGCLDKEGSEIYEGDLVGWFRPDYGNVIEFRAGSFGFEIDGLWQPLGFHTQNFALVLGNVYENPELIDQ